MALGTRRSAIALVILISCKPASGLSEAQAVEAREVVLDRDRKDIERRQLQERLENWDRAVRRMESAPPAGAPTVDVEELRLPKKARHERDAAWRELRRNRLDNAEKKATKALAVYPDFPGAYLVRGEIRLKSGRSEAAEADFEKAIALRPDAGWIPGEIATIYLRNEQPDMALLRIKSAIARLGESPAFLCFKGRAEFMLKRFDEAELSFRRSLSFEPGEHVAVFYLARICCSTGRYDETIRLLRPLLSERDLKVDRLQVIALIDHAKRLLSMQTQVQVP